MASFKSFVAASAVLSLVNGALAWSAGPGPKCVDFTPFVYAGCFADSGSPRALGYSSDIATASMTVEICVNFCKANGYRYAGLEYYGECWCGASVVGHQIADSQCSYPCSGDSSESCGGSYIISVYQDPTFPPDDITTISDYQPSGCWTESNQGRTLIFAQSQVPTYNFTVESCLFACKGGGYPLAGVEYGQECYCGVVLGNGTQQVDPSECNMPCNGNATEKCGGPSLLNLYVAKDLESSQPCNFTLSYTSSSTAMPSTSSTASAASSTSSVITTSPSSTEVSTSSSTSTTCSTSGVSTTSSTSASTTSSTSASTASSTSALTTSSTSALTTSSTSASTTSTTGTTPATTPVTTPVTTVTPCTTTTLTTKTTTSLATLCTTTVAPICEYRCGSWCSNPLPNFNSYDSCSVAANNCEIQVSSCFSTAPFPDSMKCFDFWNWCSSVNSYCSTTCNGAKCDKDDCKSKNPPNGPPPSTTAYTCTPSSTRSTTKSVTSTTCVLVPTASNICNQPNNPSNGYSYSSPVGSVPLPVLTCNNLKSDYDNGNCFKLYSDSDSSKCPSYNKNSVPQACKDACDTQYNNCVSTYADSCRSNPSWGGKDSYDTANWKCEHQHQDCITANSGVSGGKRCGSWNKGWNS